MANSHRGEITHTLNNKDYTLCLTLGALAELEEAFDNSDIIAIAERFENGRISANDAIKIIGAGLRGAGNKVTDEEVADMTIAKGATGYISLVTNLLKATFAFDHDIETEKSPTNKTKKPSTSETQPPTQSTKKN